MGIFNGLNAQTHADIKALLERVPPTSHNDVFVMPAVPTLLLTLANAVLTGPATRSFLITLWRKRASVESYARAMQTLGEDPLL